MTYEIIPLSAFAKNITGHSYGMLTAIAPIGKKSSNIDWLCICDCGTETTVTTGNLGNGTHSCGCQQNKISHGLSDSPEYIVWAAMIQRTTNPNNKAFKNYGGRGIGVSANWLVFDNFIRDMGRRHSSNLTLEREDNSLGYSKENCVWETTLAQSRNTRSNRWITFNGHTKCLQDWADLLGVWPSVLSRRIKKHGVDKALAACNIC